VIRSRTSAAANVLLGWFGVPVPTSGKQRKRTRASSRKTSRQRAAGRSSRADRSPRALAMSPINGTLVGETSGLSQQPPATGGRGECPVYREHS